MHCSVCVVSYSTLRALLCYQAVRSMSCLYEWQFCYAEVFLGCCSCLSGCSCLCECVPAACLALSVLSCCELQKILCAKAANFVAGQVHCSVCPSTALPLSSSACVTASSYASAFWLEHYRNICACALAVFSSNQDVNLPTGFVLFCASLHSYRCCSVTGGQFAPEARYWLASVGFHYS